MMSFAEAFANSSSEEDSSDDSGKKSPARKPSPSGFKTPPVPRQDKLTKEHENTLVIHLSVCEIMIIVCCQCATPRL